MVLAVFWCGLYVVENNRQEKSDMKIIESHDIKFIRTGKCKRCGACEKKKCPHFSMVNGLATCDVYEKRDEVCQLCTNDSHSIWYDQGKPVTHSSCKEFPDGPFCRVVLKGICGFKFTPLTKEDEKKYKEYLKIWRLHT